MKMFLQKIAALLYGMVIRVRNMLFDKDILKGVQYDIPIVCIGNITAGGTGKTPMVELMIAHFSKTHSVAVLSRGYKRKTKGYKVVDAFDSYIDVGDEPLQIKRKFPQVPVVVCEHRVEGINRLRQQFEDVNLIIMDDGFQHRWVKPYINIVMIDYTRPVDKDSFMPLGQLRDSMDSLHRANIFVFTKCPQNTLQRDMSLMIAGLKKKPSQATYFTRPTCRDIRSLDGIPVLLPMHSKVIALSGIGNNDSFFDGLATRYRVLHKIGFEDHHHYLNTDVELFTAAFEQNPEASFIITTEKDAVKLASLDSLPESLRGRIFYECIGMEFIPYNTDDSAAKVEDSLYELLNKEIKRFNDGTHIRGC